MYRFAMIFFPGKLCDFLQDDLQPCRIIGRGIDFVVVVVVVGSGSNRLRFVLF